ncbi:hypothetical protein AWB71_00920 [Caballeronia peredens]|nr:hypothetical protein AWB71_00920 [Caballeronia peredens]
MGAETPLSFSTIVAWKRFEFISCREVLEKLAAHTGDPLSAVAEFLKHIGVHNQNTACLVGPERRVEPIDDSASVEAILDETIRSGSIPDSVSVWDQANATADGDGWMRGAFVIDLRKQKFSCPDSLEEAPPLTKTSINPGAPQPPEWAVEMRGMPSLSLSEAASVMAGVDPHDSPWDFDQDSERRIKRFLRMLTLAVDAGELSGSTWSDDRNAQQEIAHAELRAWCRSRGYLWLVPEIAPTPATDAEALALIDDLKLANGHLSAMVDELVAARDHAVADDGSAAEIARLKANVEHLLSERDALSQANDRLRSVLLPRTDYLVPVVAAVQREFWADWDDTRPRPKSEVIVAWVMEKFPDVVRSVVIAGAVDKVACPFSRDPRDAKRL